MTFKDTNQEFVLVKQDSCRTVLGLIILYSLNLSKRTQLVSQIVKELYLLLRNKEPYILVNT